MADVIIVYDSNTGNTAKAAAEIYNGVAESGVDVEMKKVEDTTVEDLKKAKGVILGSPCVNDNYSNLMREFVDTKFRDAKPSDKIGAVFGTYKWNGGNVHRLENDLRWLGVRLVTEGVNAHKHADNEIVKKLRELGRKVGEEVKKL